MKRPSVAGFDAPRDNKANGFRSDAVFYAFVDLKTDEEQESCKSSTRKKPPMPDVFIVPSDIVAADYDEYLKQPKEKQTGFWFGFATEREPEKDDKTWHVKEWQEWFEAWPLITNCLGISKA